MTLKELETQAMSTLTSPCDNLTYALTGLVGEVGEIMELIAKGRRRGELSMNNDTVVLTTSDEAVAREFALKVADEAFDAVWFTILICRRFGVPFEEAMARGLAKLAHRKQTNTIDTHTDH